MAFKKGACIHIHFLLISGYLQLIICNVMIRRCMDNHILNRKRSECHFLTVAINDTAPSLYTCLKSHIATTLYEVSMSDYLC